MNISCVSLSATEMLWLFSTLLFQVPLLSISCFRCWYRSVVPFLTPFISAMWRLSTCLSFHHFSWSFRFFPVVSLQYCDSILIFHFLMLSLPTHKEETGIKTTICMLHSVTGIRNTLLKCSDNCAAFPQNWIAARHCCVCVYTVSECFCVHTNGPFWMCLCLVHVPALLFMH